jgi:glycosyltransferase involved in cell wall biosynthesis
MRVAFDHHSPFMLAHGGFQIQIERTLSALKNIGVDADWLRFWDTSSQPDIIHFFGKVHAGYLRFAKDKGIRTVISELHTGLGSHPKWKHAVQRQVIGLTKAYMRPLARRMNWDNYELADAIVALTPFEEDLMHRIFHAPSDRMHVIPNGVDDVFLQPSSIAREDWLLCTAVIHPRKRVLELAQAAVIARRQLKIYGRPYSESDSYFLKFKEVVAQSQGLVEWCGEVTDRKELASLYRRAQAFVLPSTMESLSLSALEAAACHCPLVLTDLPWAKTTFGSCATYLPNSNDPARIASALRQYTADNPNTEKHFRVLSWEDVARQIKHIYTNIIAR